jgi:hypothetical protein
MNLSHRDSRKYLQATCVELENSRLVSRSLIHFADSVRLCSIHRSAKLLRPDVAIAERRVKLPRRLRAYLVAWYISLQNDGKSRSFVSNEISPTPVVYSIRPCVSTTLWYALRACSLLVSLCCLDLFRI